MLDPVWQAAWDSLLPQLKPDDRILAPIGDWPTPPVGTLRHYTDRIEVQNASVVILHKGRLNALPREALVRLCNEWQIVFANEVFVCFLRDGPRRFINSLRRHSRHFLPVRHHLRTRHFKRLGNTIFFVHIPKTAGTTVWNAIGHTVRAKAYYDSTASFRANPPSDDQFDLVGGHIPLATFQMHASPQDRFIGLLRDPVLRFRAAFLHSRRPYEDPKTFTPTMRLMRELPFKEFLAHPDARQEANLQLLMLGGSPGNDDDPTDRDVFVRACRALDSPRNLFMTTDHVAKFIADSRIILQTRPSTMPTQHLNVSDLDAQADDLAEFAACLPQIRALAAPELVLYERLRAHS
ncbi:hypothetical protein AA101099_2199 [Neoasaia chiangmaiensis NBRC 101099]|uniref:Uncharacterized protein n=1 Tax=Neoasaia chiangmaiensis TaxID=320497 RepID=A0A1U9KT38_9PROT|nr:sulfotransferase family 2 domain-containing protein [Neoasaia chiangmaiensis]AQS88840.1 hypothetical protein A0U93_13930 [Neoasaia chiangmaiensis]GBR40620.1 hypothetical protein AA101099_2199 [Neoasaia chiangmaiensis NBRC 101099]GEN13813.1 hypothetical protein NCH01_02440 [Neoasaia chiangmaiensis]